MGGCAWGLGVVWCWYGTTPQNEGKTRMTYSIQINEWQRKLLVEAIRNMPMGAVPEIPENESFGFCGPERRLPEAWNLVGMLEGLPELEAENPGQLNGFCL